MWRLIRPKGRHLAALAVFLSLLLTLLHVTARHTDAYQAAERFISSDARISESIGTVQAINFKFWDGFHFTSSSNGGDANFTFEVVTNRGLSIVEVKLLSSSGVWRVVIADVRSSNGATLRIVGAVGLLSTWIFC